MKKKEEHFYEHMFKGEGPKNKYRPSIQEKYE